MNHFHQIESPVQFNNTDGDTSDGSDDFDSDDNNTDSNFDNSNDISVEGIDYGNDDDIDEDLLNIRSNTSNEFTGSNNNFDALENETDDEAEELYDDLHEKNDTAATSINDSNNTSKTEDDNDDDDDDDYDDNDEDNEDDDDADDEDDLSLDESMKSLRRSSGGPSRFLKKLIYPYDVIAAVELGIWQWNASMNHYNVVVFDVVKLVMILVTVRTKYVITVLKLAILRQIANKLGEEHWM